MKKIFTTAAFLLLFLNLTSCIYPYNPQVEGVDGYIVIEGDILVGSQTKVKVSYSQKLNEKSALYHPSCKVWVESSSGERLDAVKVNNVYRIDTENSDESLQYRLCVINEENGRSYESDWLKVNSSGVIDDFTWRTGEDRLFFYVSCHGGDDDIYFKWSYDEDWEYHSRYNASWRYDYQLDTIVEIPFDDNRFYCWDKDESTTLMVATTSNLSRNVLTDHEIYSVPFQDRKLSYLYSCELHQQVISKAEYDYLYTLEQNSGNVGDLFSPMPTEMRGNIHGVTDEKELVLGYISASKVVSRRVFFDNLKNPVFRETQKCQDPIHIGRKSWRSYFVSNYDFIERVEEDMGSYKYMWGEKRCVDCTALGGTKNKPDFWPNSDK